VLAVACVPVPISWEDTRAACGLAEGDGPPVPWDTDGSVFPISQACASSLGDVVGLQWDEFGSSAHEVVLPETTVDYVLGALFTVVASPTGTCADVVEAWPGLADYQAAEPAAQGRCDDLTAPASAFWFHWVADPIDRVGFVMDDGCAMSEGAYGTADVCNVIDDEDPAWRAPAGLASSFVHEATHSYGLAHHASSTSCSSFDEGTDGAYGMQARWLHSWLDTNQDGVPAVDVAMYEGRLRQVCSRIRDLQGLDACAGFAGTFCEGGAPLDG
jgi:hypothetical protein